MDHYPDPNHQERDQHLADRLAIPGDVRPAVWRTPPPQPPGYLTPQLAQLLLDGYTRVGDLVIDVDDDIAFAATAAASGRRHHGLGGDIHLATLGHSAGYIDLILMRWPRPAANPHWLLLACRSLLYTAGHLAVAVSADPSRRVAQLGALYGAADTAGLRSVGHISAVAPTPDKPAPGGTLATAIADGGDPEPPVSPHTDVLIFEPDGDHHD